MSSCYQSSDSTAMAKLFYSLLVLTVLAAACSAEAPFKSRNNIRRFPVFQRQEEEPTPVSEEPVADPAPYPPKEDAPYPPAGITPETPFELPTETTTEPKPAQEYGPPAQEYGPPAAPSQEYGPPEGSGQEPVVISDQTVVIEEPQSERIIVYRVPFARKGRFVAKSAKIIHLRH